MAIGGFGGALANLGAITQGEQQYENQDQAMAYRRALLQKAEFDMAQARRQQELQHQIASGSFRGFLNQQQPGSPFGGGPMQGVGQPVGGPMPGGPGAGTQPQPQPMMGQGGQQPPVDLSRLQTALAQLESGGQ